MKQIVHISVPLLCYCDLEWPFFSLLWHKRKYEALYSLSVLTTVRRQVLQSGCNILVEKHMVRTNDWAEQAAR